MMLNLDDLCTSHTFSLPKLDYPNLLKYLVFSQSIAIERRSYCYRARATSKILVDSLELKKASL